MYKKNAMDANQHTQRGVRSLAFISKHRVLLFLQGGPSLVAERRLVKLHDQQDLKEQQGHRQESVHVAIGIIERDTRRSWSLPLQGIVFDYACRDHAPLHPPTPHPSPPTSTPTPHLPSAHRPPLHSHPPLPLIDLRAWGANILQDRCTS